MTAYISGSWGWVGAISALASDVATDANGNVYVAGGFSGSNYNAPLDFDPGAGEYTIQARNGIDPAYGDGFLAKYDSQGTFVWVRALTVAWGRTGLRNIEIAADGSIRAVGTAYNQHVWSPSSLEMYAPAERAETLSSVEPGQTLGFACSFSSDGDFQWITAIPRGATSFVTPSLDRATDSLYVGFDSENLYRVTATGVLESSPLPYRRLSDLGGTTGRLLLERIATDIYGNLFLAGSMRGGADFDPSPNTFELYSSFEWGWNSGRTRQIRHWSDDVFLAKYTPAGSLEWVTLQGVPTKHETLQHFAIDPGGTTAIAASNSIYNSNVIISTFTPNGSPIWSTEVAFDSTTVRLSGLAYDAAAKLVLLTQNGFVDIDPASPPTLTWRDRIFDGFLNSGHYDAFGRAVVWSVGPIGYGAPPRHTRMNSSGSFPIVSGTRNQPGAASGFPGSYFAMLTEVNVPPVAVGLTTSTITLQENTAVPTRLKLADIEIYDDPRGDNAYTLTGLDADFFEIDGAALYLRPDVDLDYERKPAYDVTVSAADPSLLQSQPVTTSFQLTLANVNEAPTDISLATASVPENLAPGKTVGSLAAVDEDAEDTIVFTLVAGDGDIDNAAFQIVGNQLQTALRFDYEARAAYSVRVRATDASGLWVEESFEISIADVEDLDFESLPIASGGTFFQAIAAVDCDGDSDIDLIATIVEPGSASRRNSLAWYENDGTGTFSEQVIASGLAYSQEIVCADLDGDGRLDIAVTEQDTGSMRIYVGSPNGFTLLSVISGVPNVVGLATVDFDHDGDEDLVSISHWSGAVRLHTNNGMGEFSTTTIASAEYGRHIECADLDQDGDVDLVVAEQYVADANRRNLDLRTTLLINSGSGTFTKQYLRGGEVAAVAADVDGDGILDIISRNVTNVFLHRGIIGGGYVTHQVVSDTMAGGFNSWSVELALADLDGDTRLDVITGMKVDGIERTAVYRQKSDGTFFPEYTLVPPVAAVADFDGDGIYDIIGGALGGPLVFGRSTLNAPPRDIILSQTFVAENLAAGTALSLLTTNDPDAGDTFTYSLVAGSGDTDNSLFAVAGDTLLIAAPLNFEDGGSYSIRLRSTDAGGLTTEKTFVLNVLDVNESPTGLSLTNPVTFLPENTVTTGRIKVADIVVTDDALGTNSLSLSGADAASFQIDGLALYLKAGTDLNFEAKHAYSVTVTVQDIAVGGSSAVTVNYGLAITDVNEAPIAISLTHRVTTLPENSVTTSRIKVADIVVTDDAIGTNSISLSGADAASFEIDGLTLYLKAGTDLNFESQSDYSVTARVQDSAVAGSPALTDTYGLAITDVNEAPTALSLTNVTASLPENTATTSRIKVADIVITDDALGTNTLSLTGADADSFQLDGLSLYLKADTVLNFEAKTSYVATVVAQDTTLSGSAALTTNYALVITDLPEAPAAPRTSAPAFFTVVEDTPTALVFAAAPFSDSDSKLTKAMTVTLTIPAGSLAATSAGGVTVAGTTTVRTFTGSLSNLNAYFTASPGRVIYTPARNSTTTTLLSIAIAEQHGGRTLTSRSASRLQIVAVNDAPVVFAPARFVVREDTRTNLPWPATPAGFTDIDSPALSVTVSVPDGSVFAATAGGVTVTGTPTARILTGSPTALTAYFKTLGRVAYLPALDNTAPRTLTTTVTDGVDTRVATSTIAITPVNDAPRILAAAVINGSAPSTPVEITYDTLRTATNATDVEVPTPSLLIQTILTGTLQRWNGSAWVRVSTTAGSPLGQRTLQPGQRLRWIPPSGSTGLQNAFRVTARDGVAASAATCTVRISIG